MSLCTSDECPCATCVHDPPEEPDAGPTAASGESGGVNVLQEIRTDGVNGFSDEAEEWEEVEFLVDSGASATVVSEDMIKAVKASSPDPSKSYKLADGSIIPNKGEMFFKALTDEGHGKSLTTQVAEVDKALLSVAQVVHNGGKVVFSPSECYVESASGKARSYIEQRGGLYILKMWVPRDQEAPFTGQAGQRP